MSEAIFHDEIAAVLASTGLFHEGSIVINDQARIEARSRAFAPYAIIETADAVQAESPFADAGGTITYNPTIRLVDFAGGKGEKLVLDAFRELRHTVIVALMMNLGALTGIASEGAITPFPTTSGDQADCIAQGLILEVTEYL